MKKKTKSKSEFFRSFFASTANFKKWRMLSKNKHHIRKEHVPTRSGMDFSGDLSIFSRKTVTTIWDKRVAVADCESKTKILVRDREKTTLDQLFLIAVFEVGFGISDRENLEIHSNRVACCILVSHITTAILNSEFRDQMHNQRSHKPASTKFHLSGVTFCI